MTPISAKDAAVRLGVSERRIRAMIDKGQLRAEKVGSRWLIDSNALERVEKRQPRGGRPFSPSHALGALFLASDEEAAWLSDYERWRIRKYALPRLRNVLPRLSARARVRYLYAPDAALRACPSLKSACSGHNGWPAHRGLGGAGQGVDLAAEEFTLSQRREGDTLHYEVTVEDSSVFTRPWTMRVVHKRRAHEEPWESACFEGNKPPDTWLLNGETPRR